MWHEHWLASPYIWLLISRLLSQDMSQIFEWEEKWKTFHILKVSCIGLTLRSNTEKIVIKVSSQKVMGIKNRGGCQIGPKGDTESWAPLSQCFNGVTHWPDCIVRLSFNSNSLFVMTALPFRWGVLVRHDRQTPTTQSGCQTGRK